MKSVALVVDLVLLAFHPVEKGSTYTTGELSIGINIQRFNSTERLYRSLDLLQEQCKGGIPCRAKRGPYVDVARALVNSFVVQNIPFAKREGMGLPSPHLAPIADHHHERRGRQKYDRERDHDYGSTETMLAKSTNSFSSPCCLMKWYASSSNIWI